MILKIILFILLLALVSISVYLWIYCPRKKSPVKPPSGGGDYEILHDWKGVDLQPSMNKGWHYFTDADPTKGVPNYGAWDDLMVPDGDNIIIKTAQKADSDGRRKSIRIQSDKTFNTGLFIMKANHMPEGLSTWPAFWLTSRVKAPALWPCGGEIDIIEIVNSVDDNSSKNASTLHTDKTVNGKSCNQAGVKGISHNDCNFSDKPDSGCGCDHATLCPYIGCGVQLDTPLSGGKGFNANGGGVYAMRLTEGGQVTIWFFEKGKIPNDISTNKPDPDKWDTTYMTKFNACPGHFKDLEIIFNTTFCGDWAGNAFPGGMDKCKDYVKTGDFSKSFWNIEYVKVFQQK